MKGSGSCWGIGNVIFRGRQGWEGKPCTVSSRPCHSHEDRPGSSPPAFPADPLACSNPAGGREATRQGRARTSQTKRRSKVSLQWGGRRGHLILKGAGRKSKNAVEGQGAGDGRETEKLGTRGRGTSSRPHPRWPCAQQVRRRPWGRSHSLLARSVWASVGWEGVLRKWAEKPVCPSPV